ncbi:MAG: cytidine deaminase [Chloroflexi bacterium B3_Chlor]|nr:MAG: cytidine deaminase [Chloroflexi bacterium B3_Chlor]
MDIFAELVTLGREARDRAYAPYSGFAVGAALRTKSGGVYSGSNVENASYGMTICAERVAIFNAVSAGEREFEALAVVSEELAPPCGACRQVLAEFGLNTKVIIADLGDSREVHTVRDLLPTAFTPTSLPRGCSESEGAS